MCAASSASTLHAAVRVSSAGELSIEVAFDQALGGPPAGAYGTYVRDTLNTTGWATLTIHTNASFPDALAAEAAGYLEGFTTAAEINAFAINAHGGKVPYSPLLATWVAANQAYVDSMVTAHPNDPFFYHVGLTVAQQRGLYAGYSAAMPAADRFSADVIYALTMVGDLDDLCPAFGCTSSLGQHTCTSKAECDEVRPEPPKKARHGNGHCSILVKPLGYVSAPSDIVFGHTTWCPFTIMGPRILKLYDFPFRTSSADVTVVPGVSISFTSYPAVLYSFDDWYTISSGLTVSETTIINANPALWAMVVPTSVVIWSRAMAANRLASSGAEWVATLSQQNSGTYNNAWHVVDWKTWSPGSPIPDGFLWHVEQMPGTFSPIDLSPVLRAQTYWSSYNRVFEPSLFNLTGGWAQVAEYGPHFSWDQTARAQIFRRDQSSVTDLSSYRRMLRYNDFEVDPLSGQGCVEGVHSGSDAISERGDLTPASGCTVPGTSQQNEGGIDCKYTSSLLLAAGKHPYLRMMAQVGPTADHQPIFNWSTSPFPGLSHVGQPDSWDFPWIDVDPEDQHAIEERRA